MIADTVAATLVLIVALLHVYFLVLEMFLWERPTGLRVFRMTADQAYRVMMTAHQKGACVVAVYTKDVAETKATEATDAGRKQGYPLLFTTEPEE